MRIFVADKLATFVAPELSALGYDVVVEVGLAPKALTDRLAALTPTVLVVRSTTVPADAVAASPELGLVIRAGAGVNTIDVGACSGRA